MDTSQILSRSRRERVKAAGFEFQRATLDDCKQMLKEDILRETDWKTLRQYAPTGEKAAAMLYSMCDAVFALRDLRTGMRIALLCVGPRWKLGERKITSIALVSSLMVDHATKKYPAEFLKATRDVLKNIHEVYGTLGNTLRREDFKRFGRYVIAAGAQMFSQEANKDLLVWLYEGPGQRKRTKPVTPTPRGFRRKRET